jgi:hypothetical protein
MAKRKITVITMSYVLKFGFGYNYVGIVKEKGFLIGNAMVLLIEFVCNQL